MCLSPVNMERAGDDEIPDLLGTLKGMFVQRPLFETLSFRQV